MGAFLQDLQYAMRCVKRAPLVTCLMVLALSVGIGLNAGMFTMIVGFWFRARACVAVLLAVSGVYGVIAFSMSQRTREFGIRMALGATTGSVLGSVLRWGARQIATGLLLGLLLAVPAAWAWARLTKGSPFQTGVFDLNVYGLTVILLLGVALVAIYVPAHRATKLDPMVALRHE